MRAQGSLIDSNAQIVCSVKECKIQFWSNQSTLEYTTVEILLKFTATVVPSAKMNGQGGLNEMSFSCFLLYMWKVLCSWSYSDICTSQACFRPEAGGKLHYRCSLPELSFSLARGTINFDVSNSVGPGSLRYVFSPLVLFHCHRKETERHALSKCILQNNWDIFHVSNFIISWIYY